MKRLLLFFIILNLTSTLICQDNWKLYPSSDSLNSDHIDNDTVKTILDYSLNNGQIIVFKDSRIDSIQKEISTEQTIMGWTVQIMVSQQKEEIKNTRLKFIKAFPDQPIFDGYKDPNTYLFVGRFYDRNSAYVLKNEIKPLFKNTIVINRKIDLPVIPKKENHIENNE